MVAIERQKRGRAPRIDPTLADSNDSIEIAMDRANGGAAERLLASHDRSTVAPLQGVALWALGKRDEARAKLGAARGMDLTSPDRARLERLMRAAATNR